MLNRQPALVTPVARGGVRPKAWPFAPIGRGALLAFLLASAVLAGNGDRAQGRGSAGRARAGALVRRGEVLAYARLRYRPGERVALLSAASVHGELAAAGRPLVRLSGVPRELSGPLAAGARVGEAQVSVGGRVLGRVDVVTAHAVSAASLGQRLRSYFSRPLTLLLVAGLVGCSLLLALMRRRVTRRPERRERALEPDHGLSTRDA